MITGGSSGLGAELAKQLASQGERLLVSGRNQQRLQCVENSCSGLARTYQADLADAESVSSLFDELEHPPQTIIHCAGSGYFAPLAEQDPQNIQQLINNNLLAAALVLQQAVKRYQHLPINVVVVMSTAAQIAKAGESSYCAVKWGVRGLVESLRLELKHQPMNLVAVYPGGMATEFWPSSGKNIDTSSFMTAAEAATMLLGSLQHSQRGFVSDITINRR